MKRYFFDIVSPETPEHDYSGSEHPSPEAALAVAEMIAIDLGVPADSKWIGWKVCVRDAYRRLRVHTGRCDWMGRWDVSKKEPAVMGRVCIPL